MNRRTRTAHRSSPSRSEPFLKYLKPGALAQIRDSRISNSRSHIINWISQIRSTPPMSPSPDAGLGHVTVAADRFPPLTNGNEGNIDNSVKVCGICHDPAEDQVICEEIYEPISSDSASESDSEGEDNQDNVEVSINLNYRPEGRLKEPSRKKGKVKQKNKRGEPITEEDLMDYDGFDEVEVIPQKAVEIDFLGLTSKNKRRKTRSGCRKRVLMWHVWENEHEKWVDENFNLDFDLDVQNNVVNEVAETPTDLIMPLLRYQKEWLAWALKQEESEAKGGIPADEMGMGKTIQAIALVLAKREINWTFHEPGSSTGLPHIKGTLVACPVVAVSQWVSEIERFTAKGCTKILVYHGANREKSSKQFLDYYIKSRRCNTAKTVLVLDSTYKWALSGTPLQNRVGELYSLVCFLQLVPYSYYLCKDCDCRTLDHSSASQCSNCAHSSVRHFYWWNKVSLQFIFRFCII